MKLNSWVLRVSRRWVLETRQMPRYLTMGWHPVPADQLSSRGRVRSDLPASTMNFSLWQLAHAMVKADTARGLPFATIVRRANGFLMEWGAALASANGNLRFDASEYADFVETALTGRVAQGLALLYCLDQDYVYLSHYSHLLSGTRRPRSNGPDFVVEKRDGSLRAFLEAKGSVAAANRPANVRPALRKALDQLEIGFEHLAGQVAEGYATLTLLRVLDDQKDSEGFVVRIANTEEPRKPTHPRADLVRRANYGRWLAFLGLTSLARGLLEPEEKRDIPPVTVSILNLGGREIAFVPLWPIPMAFSAVPIPTGEAYLIGGLGVSWLEPIARAAREQSLLSADELPSTQMETHVVGGGIISEFTDGSVLGVLPSSALESSTTRQL